MNLPQHPQLDVLAGEYVLGTLHGAARRRFERDLNQQAVREAVQFWEVALADLNALGEIDPQWKQADLLQRIEQRLGWQDRSARAGLWSRWLPAWGIAAVTAVALLLWSPWQVDEPAFEPEMSLAMANEEGTLRWQVAIDYDSNQLDVQVLSSPDIPANEDLELWLLVADAAPVSLGLISEHAGDVQRIQAVVGLAQGQGLAVSREPTGGSPTGAPTGPVIAVQMYPTG